MVYDIINTYFSCYDSETTVQIFVYYTDPEYYW